MEESIHIVIAGGGTAGWMSAAALVAATPGNRYRITLVESDAIGSVGVGEATLPQVKEFNDFVGLIEADLMQKTSATFKLGIEFRDWGFAGSAYIHPFGTFGRRGQGIDFLHQWVRASRRDAAANIERYSYAIQACRQARFEFPVKDTEALNSTYGYAYHLDATLYARYLRSFAESRGLVRKEGKIVSVERDPEDGRLRRLRLESGESVEGDFFLDCSGFRSLLAGETLGVPFEDWSRWLVCDRAVTVPSDRTDPLLPYTRSTALSAGWQWRIPLQHRTGNGYVYCSEYLDDDEAATTLLSNLESSARADPKFLRFTAGRRIRAWEGNCVAVGLSGGFLEPLESTSIYLIQVAVLNFVRLLPGRRPEPELAEEFNRLVDLEYDRIRDFLILHYHLNRRDDSELWRYCRDMDIPDSLRWKIGMFRHRGYIDVYRFGLFSPPSWISVFLGQGLLPDRHAASADRRPVDEDAARLEELASSIDRRVAAMPDHGRFLADYCPTSVTAA